MGFGYTVDTEGRDTMENFIQHFERDIIKTYRKEL